jgi:YfiH family protein
MKYFIGTVKQNSLIKNEWIVEKQGDLLLVFSPLLKQYSKFVHAFTTRQGGKSEPPFHSFNVGKNNTMDEKVQQDASHNREILCKTLNLPFPSLKTAKKLVHSAKVVSVETVVQPNEVDGIVCQKTLSPIYMTFADCVPIIIYDSVKHLFCLIHAGWRGTASGISKEGINFMVEECGSKIDDLVCAIGPAIGSCCYPVGVEVIEELIYSLCSSSELDKVRDEIKSLKTSTTDKNVDTLWSFIEKLDLQGLFKRGPEKIHVDLKAINASQLLVLGVKKIDVTSFCTSCKEDLFYSFRRSFVKEEGPTGRQAAIACLL